MSLLLKSDFQCDTIVTSKRESCPTTEALLSRYNDDNGVPIGGTSANTDIYSFSIIKTSATPTYNVFASVQSFF